MIALYYVKGNELYINDSKIKFDYPILKAERYNNLIIVLLEFKNSDDPIYFSNALYAISDNAQIVWKMEDVRKHISNLHPDPLVGFLIKDDNIVATDFSARKYTVNINDGTITGYRAGRW